MSLKIPLLSAKNERVLWEEIRKKPRIFRTRDIKGLKPNVAAVTLKSLEAKGLIRKISPGTWERITDDYFVISYADFRVKKAADIITLILTAILFIMKQFLAASVALFLLFLYSFLIERKLVILTPLSDIIGHRGERNNRNRKKQHLSD